MKIRVPDYYKNFKCIDTECTDSCCAGWEVEVDDKSYEYYKSVEGEFGDRIRSVMVTNNGEHSFTLQNGRCPFLNNKNLCDLYTELGEDKLCDTCTNYPRFIEEYGSMREIGIALSCKTAAKLILENSDKVTFEVTENDEKITAYNDIDPELYMQLLSSRKTAIEIIQNRSININIRIAIVLTFARDIQKKIDRNKLSRIADIKDKYSSKEYINKLIGKFDKYSKNPEARHAVKYFNMEKYLRVYKNMEIINEDWPNMIDKDIESLHALNVADYATKYAEFARYYADKEYEYEHIMVYFIYRYFLKAVNDKHVLSKIKMGAVSYLIIKELDVLEWMTNDSILNLEQQIELTHLYSREVEHSFENFEELGRMFKSDDMFDYKQLMIMLLN